MRGAFVRAELQAGWTWCTPALDRRSFARRPRACSAAHAEGQGSYLCRRPRARRAQLGEQMDEHLAALAHAHQGTRFLRAPLSRRSALPRALGLQHASGAALCAPPRARLPGIRAARADACRRAGCRAASAHGRPAAPAAKRARSMCSSRQLYAQRSQAKRCWEAGSDRPPARRQRWWCLSAARRPRARPRMPSATARTCARRT
jgi:hypothetical protein